MVLSEFESAKSSTMKSQSRIQTKLQAKSTIRAKILDKSAIRCINKIRKLNPCKIFARSEIRTFFSVKSDDPKTYSPPPPKKKMLISSCYRVITGASYDIKSTDDLATLGWQTLDKVLEIQSYLQNLKQ
jgi:hypothetical protein